MSKDGERADALGGGEDESVACCEVGVLGREPWCGGRVRGDEAAAVQESLRRAVAEERIRSPEGETPGQ